MSATLQKTILAAITREIALQRRPERLEEIAAAPRYDRPELEKARALAAKGIVPIDLEFWLGHRPTPSQRTLVSRALNTLEAAGRIRRHKLAGCNERNSHVELLTTEAPANA